MTHRTIPILPTHDLAASRSFYERLGFEVSGDYGDYLVLEDASQGELHLRYESGWKPADGRNPFGIYLHVTDVDALAERVRELIIEPGAPQLKPWGNYEFAVSDPTGVLVRIGREAGEAEVSQDLQQPLAGSGDL